MPCQHKTSAQLTADTALLGSSHFILRSTKAQETAYLSHLAMSGSDNRSDLPPPNYEWSQHDFDHKVATATERSLHQSFSPVSGPSHDSNGSNEDEFEAWSDEKFQAAARAYEARQAKRRMQGTPQPGASGSSSGMLSDYSRSEVHFDDSLCRLNIELREPKRYST